jgi:5-methyltetrahydropteroyltriglutamate--homocysteine methyltransferase
MKTTNLGFPNVLEARIKRAVEGFWKGDKTIAEVHAARRGVEEASADIQKLLDLRPVHDIALYDRLFETALLFGIAPKRFGNQDDIARDAEHYLLVPRGTDDAQASPMVKWFNTNYHVVQPEIERDPKLLHVPALEDTTKTKVALIGPWTLLSYALNRTERSEGELFSILAEQYVQLINRLSPGVVQLEEPSFVTRGMPESYESFVSRLEKEVHLHTYFGPVNSFADRLFELDVEGIGLDFVDGQSNLSLLSQFPSDKLLIAGIVNGRNVWPVSTRTKAILDTVREHITDDALYISSSCSLLHVPLTAENEDVTSGTFSFALEKLEELEAIKNGTVHYREVSTQQVPLPDEVYRRSRKTFHVSDVPFPTTTIGSFPQTPELRAVRRELKEGSVSQEEYDQFIKSYISRCIAAQERLGLDVLVHGEPERNDMVQYFAEQLNGFVAITSPVQSYGTRHVRPPVIVGDVSLDDPMTVQWTKYAQSLTDKPVKGIFTGPVTMVQWAFPREDISREAQFYDVARALSKEVAALVEAGIVHIQIDEPALREAMPLDPSQREHYLRHAVNAFRLTYAAVPDETVVHSHMCFSAFDEIMGAINNMGVDVLSIEDSKAGGKVAAALHEGGFEGSIGLGVYDVHSPRIPTVDEMTPIPQELLNKGFNPRRVWINPDCGAKTRGFEVYDQLENMVSAAHQLRADYP